MSALPVGTIVPYLGDSTTVPAGWLLCNGGVVPRSTYAALFAAIGVTYGAGDGSTTFRLPGGVPSYIYASGSGTGSGSHDIGHQVTTSINATLQASAVNHTHSTNTPANTSNNIGSGGSGSAGTHSGGNTNLGTNATASGDTLGGSSNYLAADYHGHGSGISWGHGDHVHNVNAPSVGNETGHSHTLTVGNQSITNITTGSTTPPNMALWHLIKC